MNVLFKLLRSNVVHYSKSSTKHISDIRILILQAINLVNVNLKLLQDLSIFVLRIDMTKLFSDYQYLMKIWTVC